MAQAPHQIRQDIESTRADLARDVDMLADRTLPNRVVQRRWNTVKTKLRGVTEKVMGAPSDVGETVAHRAHSAMDAAEHLTHEAGDKVREAASWTADTVQQAPEMVRRQTQGNPLAAGIIAFGAGLLAASLIPETEAERRAARQLKQQAGGLVEQVREPLTESARQIKEELSSSVRDAAQQVKETAKDAAQTTAHETASAARQATEQTRQAVSDTGTHRP